MIKNTSAKNDLNITQYHDPEKTEINMTILTFYTTQTTLQLYMLWVCRVVRPWLCGIQEYNVYLAIQSC